jgi:hypothetical protein
MVGQLPKSMNKKILIYTIAMIGLITCQFGPVSAQIPVVQERTDNSATSSLSSTLNYPMIPTEEKKLAKLLSRDCQTLGDDNRSQETCSKTYSNGTVLKTVRNYETESTTDKQQMIMTELDSHGNKLDSKTVRQKSEYAADANRKIKLKEYFDIVKRPAKGKITRELVIHEFSPKTGLPVKSTWTKYVQIRNKAFASLQYHVSLSYDIEGNPLSGYAEKWAKGERVQTLFDWEKGPNETASSNHNLWQQWHDRIQRASYGEFVN